MMAGIGGSDSKNPDHDASKLYAEQEDVYFNDGRENALLQSILSLPPSKLNALRGNPQGILGEIDDFGTRRYLMNVGRFKGDIVVKEILATKPCTMLELGSYVGYSTLLFGSTLKSLGIKNARFIAIEYNPHFASIVQNFVDLAGLGDVVEVIVGSSSVAIQSLVADGKFPDGIDFVFLDHAKPRYITDLKILESLGCVRKGTAICADNVVKPGNPPYLEYVRMSPEEKRERFNEKEEFPGDWKIVYESRMVESCEPTGVKDAVEITKCMGILEEK